MFYVDDPPFSLRQRTCRTVLPRGAAVLIQPFLSSLAAAVESQRHSSSDEVQSSGGHLQLDVKESEERNTKCQEYQSQEQSGDKTVRQVGASSRLSRRRGLTIPFQGPATFKKTWKRCWQSEAGSGRFGHETKEGARLPTHPYCRAPQAAQISS